MAYEEFTDFELIRMYVERQSEGAFAALVERRVGQVYSAALRQVKDAHQAEDVTQQVFIALSRKCRVMDERVFVPAWLARATRYAARAAIRASGRRTRHEMASVQFSAGVGSAVAIEEGVVALLDEAIAWLGEKDRTAILMRYMDCRSVQEVGQKLGLTPNTATRRIERAVEKLRKFFAGRGVATTSAGVVAGLTVLIGEPAPAGICGSVVSAVLTKSAAGKASLGLISGVIAMSSKAKIAAAAVVALMFLSTLIVILNPFGTTTGKASDKDSVSAAGAAPSSGRVVPGRGGTRVMFATTPAMSYDERSGGRDTGLMGVEAIGDGDWLRYSQFRFEDGVDYFVAALAADPASAGGTLDVHLDDVKGPVVASLNIRSTSSGDAYACLSSPVRGASGVHDLYLVFTGTGCKANLAWFKFSRPGRDATRLIAASHYDVSLGIWDEGQAVTHLNKGFSMCYRRLDFGTGAKSFKAWIGAPADSAGKSLILRLDSMTGPIVGVLEVKPTGGFHVYLPQAVELKKPISGMHDLWIGFDGGDSVANIRAIQFDTVGPN